MSPIQQSGDDCLLRIKAVPGARSSQIVGPLGDRLKIRISAPPEAGKANKAITTLIAKKIGKKPREVTIEAGHTNPEKTIRITNANADELSQVLEL
jgi:uncharacterized protein